jgi:hypothetical protein
MRSMMRSWWDPPPRGACRHSMRSILYTWDCSRTEKFYIEKIGINKCDVSKKEIWYPVYYSSIHFDHVFLLTKGACIIQYIFLYKYVECLGLNFMISRNFKTWRYPITNFRTSICPKIKYTPVVSFKVWQLIFSKDVVRLKYKYVQENLFKDTVG